MRALKQTLSEQKGVAIIVAVGIMAITLTLGGSLLSLMDMEQKTSFMDELNLKAHYIAVAGVERAIRELTHDSEVMDYLGDDWAKAEMVYNEFPLGEGHFALSMQDEESKANLNTAPLFTLAKLLNVKEEELSFIKKQRDTGEPFPSVETLYTQGLLSPSIFFKSMDYLTVEGLGKVNLNTASREVLECLPGMNKALSEKLISYRRGPDEQEGTDDDIPLESMEDVEKIEGFSPMAIQSMSPFVTFHSTTFHIRSVGKIVKGGRLWANKRVEAVVVREPDRVKIHYWKESTA